MRLTLKKTILLVTILAMITIFSSLDAQLTEAKKRDIQKYLEVSNQNDQFVQMIDLVLEQFQEMSDIVSPQTWSVIRRKFVDDLSTVSDLLIPVIDKYFTHDDIKELIKFYESPIGKKLNAATPLMLQELYTIGAEWGERLTEEILNELLKMGY